MVAGRTGTGLVRCGKHGAWASGPRNDHSSKITLEAIGLGVLPGARHLGREGRPRSRMMACLRIVTLEHFPD